MSYENAGIWHGNISESTIVYSENHWSIIDSSFFPTEHFQVAKYDLGEHLCAPEVYNQITTGFTTPVLQSRVKADLYSLGLTVLKCLLFKCKKNSKIFENF